MINRIFNSKWIMPFGLFLGVSLGYFYWSSVGCLTGTCPMNSSPIMNVITGGVIAYLIISTIQENLKSKKNEKNT